MSELTNKAIAKITDEAMKINTPTAIGIEEHLTQLCKTDECASKLLNESKTLKDCIQHCTAKARPQAKGNVAMITSDEVYKWVNEYYGINDLTARPEKVDVMSML